jgi:hypothetical protein
VTDGRIESLAALIRPSGRRLDLCAAIRRRKRLPACQNSPTRKIEIREALQADLPVQSPSAK